MKRISILLWILCTGLFLMAWAQEPDIPGLKGHSILRHRVTNGIAKHAGTRNPYSTAQTNSAQGEFKEPGSPALSKLTYYEASNQFSDSSNPNGTWSYGYTKKLGRSFTLYTISGVSGLDDGWYGYTLGGTPLLVAESDLSGTHLLTLHPGPSNEQSVARWIAPSTGTFDLLGFFYGLDPVYSSDVYVLKNNVTVYHDTVAANGDEKDFSLAFSLRKGDKIDFVVATTPGNPAGGVSAGMGVAITPQLFKFTTVQYPGVPNTMIWGINNRGDIAGRYRGADNVRHGFIRRNGVFTTIDYPGLPHTYATGINDWGQVVGYAWAFDADGNVSVWQAFLWYKGKFTDLMPPGAVDSEALDINDLGYISGVYDNGDLTTSYGFVRDPSGNYFTYEVPGSYPGTTYADGLNLWGQVVGEYADPDFYYHGFLRAPNGTFTTIDFPGLDSGLSSINLWGTMVGGYCDLGGPAVCQAFLHVDSDFVPLWVPVTPYTGEYTQANKINDLGQVVGYYVGYDSIYHGFIATPVAPLGH
jgi:probable HAF family extracellular repeat protein